MHFPDDSWNLRHSKHWLSSRRRGQRRYRMLQGKQNWRPKTIIFTLEFNKTVKKSCNFVTMLHKRWWCIFLHWREVQTSCPCRRTLKLAVCSCYQCCQQTFTFDVEPRGAVEIKLSRCVYWRKNCKCISPCWPVEGRTELHLDCKETRWI